MMERLKIYVASSWRNTFQPRVVELLRAEGYEVYDFKNPGPGNSGFRWTQIDPDWENWSPKAYRQALQHPVAQQGYEVDMNALMQADLCVLVLPSGRSASLETGFFFGYTGVPPVVYMPVACEPELMYREMLIATDEDELRKFVAELALEVRENRVRSVFEPLPESYRQKANVVGSSETETPKPTRHDEG
jgi:hypothetical protein